MKTKLLFVVLVLECIIYVNLKSKLVSNAKHVININSSVDINSVKLENYLIGVVAAEMPATFSFEALKAQAVASRTFAYKKIVSGSLTYDDLYKDKGQAYITIDEMKDKWKDSYDIYYETIKSAVRETNKEIIVYNDKPINAYYFSSSNGFTEDSKYVFGEEEYLSSVEIPSDTENKEYLSYKEIKTDEFKVKLGISDSEITISNIVRSNTNHILTIEINKKKYTGVEIRKLLDLRSTDFDINVSENIINVTTRGYGHGVGMSQNGANYLAKEGKNYKEIINYFYKNVRIEKM